MMSGLRHTAWVACNASSRPQRCSPSMSAPSRYLHCGECGGGGDDEGGKFAERSLHPRSCLGLPIASSPSHLRRKETSLLFTVRPHCRCCTQTIANLQLAKIFACRLPNADHIRKRLHAPLTVASKLSRRCLVGFYRFSAPARRIDRSRWAML